MQKVKFELNNGKSMTVELYPEHAPISVENFLDLVKNGFYDGLCFHRVIPGFMIQGGGFIAENGGLKDKKAPRTIKGEFAMNGVKNNLHHGPGVLSMARTMFPDSASSQFFICVDDVPHLDAQYAGFGKVVDEESLKTAIEISTVPTKSWGYYDDIPVDPIIIEKATVIEE